MKACETSNMNNVKLPHQCKSCNNKKQEYKNIKDYKQCSSRPSVKWILLSNLTLNYTACNFLYFYAHTSYNFN